jgi:hypothetical protein
MHLSRLGRLGSLVCLAGCAPSLSSFQPAHVAPKGTVSAELGSDLSLPTGALANTYDAAKTLASAGKSRMLTEEEKVQLFVAGTNLALSPPALVNHLAVNYVPAERWEVGARYSSSAFRLGGRRQLLLQAQSGYDLTVGLGVQRWSYGFPIGDIIDIVRLEAFTRWSLDLPLVAGFHTDFYRVWGGPRLAWSTYSSELVIRAPGQAGAVASEDLARVEGSALFVGAQAGAAIGYKMLFVAAELTVVRMIGNARLDVFGRRVEADTGTFILYPGLALLGEF